jgi:tetraacyldisaccharide 4'-kinase
MRLRRLAYESGLISRTKPACRVVSIGNLSAGGTGKTQVVAFLLREAALLGVKAAAVSGGYGGSVRGSGVVELVTAFGDPARFGDEAVMLAGMHPDTPVYVGRDRAGACMAACRDSGVGLCILDDGAQHLGVARDADVFVVDPESPFGNGLCLPAGPLRELPSAMAGAGFVWFAGSAPGRSFDGAAVMVRRHAPGARMIFSTSRPAFLKNSPGGAHLPLELVQGKRVLAFCAIGRPHRFKRTVESLGPSAVDFIAFRDHHVFTPVDIAGIKERARKMDAAMIVTTTKDHARLFRRHQAEFDYTVSHTLIEIVSGQDAVRAILTG